MKKMIFVSMMAVLAIAGNALALDLNQVKIHGFISQGWLQTDKNDFYYAQTEKGTFQFNEMGISFASELTDNLRLGIQFLSRDLGDVGNNKVEVDWAFADYRYRNWLGFRAGKIKKPFGLYNRSRDVDAARTGIFLPINFYDDVPRETFATTTGIGIYGTLPGGLSYEVQYGTVQMDADGGSAKNTARLLKSTINDIETKDNYSTYLEWNTPLDGLTLAGTVFQFPSPTYQTPLGMVEGVGTCYVASAEYVRDKFTFAAEYQTKPYKFTLLQTDAILFDKTMETWYAGASYRFTDMFAMGTYYGEVYRDKDNKDLSAGRKDLALTARFDINEFWVFKLEGHLMRGLLQVQTPPKDASMDWFLFAAKVTFSF